MAVMVPSLVNQRRESVFWLM